MKHNSLRRKALSLALSLAVASAFAAPAFAEEAAAKYTVEETAYGYNLVTQEGGATLSYSPESGVTLLEDDGFAFKDLNKNGALDAYEDWRLPTADRAANLADLMIADGRDGIESIAGLMLYSAHTAVSSETVSGTEIDERARTQDGTTTMDAITTNKLRHVLVTSIASPEIGAKWSNNLQSIVEGMEYGIPCNNSSDPRHEASSDRSVQYVAGDSGNISRWPGTVGLAATYDPDLVRDFGNIVGIEYRALGIGTALSPQIDLSSEPRWSRVSGTFGDNVNLTEVLSKAVVEGYQSTYVDGEDTGWGKESIVAMIKHWPSGGPEEAGRDAHYGYGKYSVYPGNDFADQIRNFVSALSLNSKTSQAAAVMPYYTISLDQAADGTNYGNSFSNYMINELLRGEYGFTGVACTDWMITADADNDWVFQGKCWGVEDKTVAERHYMCLMAGMDQFGGNNVIGPVMEAYDMMVAEQGQEFADNRFALSAIRILTNMFNLGLFEDPYLNPEETAAIVGNPEYMAKGYEAQLKSIVMVKNAGGVIAPAGEKKTVYVPSVSYQNVSRSGEVTDVTEKVMNVDVLAQYFDLTENPEEADLAIVAMNSPSSSGFSTADKEAGGNGYIPVTLQYREYTAEAARETAIGNDPGKQFIDSVTGEFVYTDDVENRSYKGKTNVASNAYFLDALEETRAAMGDKPVLVYMRQSNPTVFTEVEPLADAIIIGYGVSDQAAAEILAGNCEPSALLPLQQPSSMVTVEEQCEDVPMDMDCYVDSEGNTYDVAFGLNWSGVISDERVATYGRQ